MRVEAMELCVTACEKHSSSNEVYIIIYTDSHAGSVTVQYIKILCTYYYTFYALLVAT